MGLKGLDAKTNMFTAYDKAKPDIDLRVLNLAAVKLTTVQVTRLSL
jgi:hypothetical protein